MLRGDVVEGLLQRIPELPRGNRLGIITTSGGGGILAADEAENWGLVVPELDPATREKIAQFIPAYGSPMNPVDITAQGGNASLLTLDEK